MNIKDKVIEVLEKDPRTRDNDLLLIAVVLREVYGIQNTFDVALDKRINGNIYESIRRQRQKAQETNPLLRANTIVQSLRSEKEARIREEMRGV